MTRAIARIAVSAPVVSVAPVVTTLSTSQARRIALAAQGFLDRPHDQPTMRTLARTVERTGVLQVDSVNVLQRAHFMPLYSRMGAYDVDLLARAQSRAKPRRLVEYWAHVQALMPVELWPLMRHRMDSYRTQKHKWWGSEVSEELVANLMAEIADRGACTARDLDDGLPRDKKHWGWNWSATKRALDYLYMTGEVAIAGRNSQFEVRYDLPERVLPADVLAAPTPTLEEANRELVRRAARSHGVATARCLADYYRMRLQPKRRRPRRAGRHRGPRRRGRARAGADRGLEPAGVPPPRRPAPAPRRGPRPAQPLRPGGAGCASAPRGSSTSTTASRSTRRRPSGSLRLLRAAVPARRGDRRPGRPQGRPAVRAPGREGGVRRAGRAAETAEELSAELVRLAGWLGMDELTVEPRGDLAPLAPFLSRNSGLRGPVGDAGGPSPAG